MNHSKISPSAIPSASADPATEGVGGGLNTLIANGATPISAPIVVKDALLTSIEARLAEEVLRLVNAFTIFHNGIVAVREELPVSAQVSKEELTALMELSNHITQFLVPCLKRVPLLNSKGMLSEQFFLHIKQSIPKLKLNGLQFLTVTLLNRLTQQDPQSAE